MTTEKPQALTPAEADYLRWMQEIELDDDGDGDGDDEQQPKPAAKEDDAD